MAETRTPHRWVAADHGQVPVRLLRMDLLHRLGDFLTHGGA
jgi:hypothetical protein